jgi:hypothetical protein
MLERSPDGSASLTRVRLLELFGSWKQLEDRLVVRNDLDARQAPIAHEQDQLRRRPATSIRRPLASPAFGSLTPSAAAAAGSAPDQSSRNRTHTDARLAPSWPDVAYAFSHRPTLEPSPFTRQPRAKAGALLSHVCSAHDQDVLVVCGYNGIVLRMSISELIADPPWSDPFRHVGRIIVPSALPRLGGCR